MFKNFKLKPGGIVVREDCVSTTTRSGYLNCLLDLPVLNIFSIACDRLFAYGARSHFHNITGLRDVAYDPWICFLSTCSLYFLMSNRRCHLHSRRLYLLDVFEFTTQECTLKNIDSKSSDCEHDSHCTCSRTSLISFIKFVLSRSRVR